MTSLFFYRNVGISDFVPWDREVLKLEFFVVKKNDKTTNLAKHKGLHVGEGGCNQLSQSPGGPEVGNSTQSPPVKPSHRLAIPPHPASNPGTRSVYGAHAPNTGHHSLAPDPTAQPPLTTLTGQIRKFPFLWQLTSDSHYGADTAD